MSSINSVRNLQILDFSKKNKKIKNLKNGESGLILAFIYILLKFRKNFFLKQFLICYHFSLKPFSLYLPKLGDCDIETLIKA